MSQFLKPESTRSIKLTYDMKDFVKNANELISKIMNRNKEILINASPDFSNAAAKYTPPNLGSNSIEKRLYERPILNLIKLLRGEYHRLLWHKI